MTCCTQEMIEEKIVWSKQMRVKIDALIQELKVNKTSAERTLCWRYLQSAKHILGEDLHELGQTTPYVNAMNPENTIVDAQADVAAAN